MVSINEKQLTYNLFFMDGYSRPDVPQKDMRKVPSRELKDPMIGKKFFDDGSDDPVSHSKNNGKIKPGEFVVLCRHGGGNFGVLV